MHVGGLIGKERCAHHKHHGTDKVQHAHAGNEHITLAEHGGVFEVLESIRATDDEVDQCLKLTTFQKADKKFHSLPKSNFIGIISSGKKGCQCRSK